MLDCHVAPNPALLTWGLPLHINHLCQFTIEILLRKDFRSSLALHWHQGLLRRNSQLKVTFSRPIDRHRASAMKVTVAKQWFDLFHRIRTEHSITDENIYNIDEKGFMIEAIQKTYVLSYTTPEDHRD
jgi:hypothetical protein